MGGQGGYGQTYDRGPAPDAGAAFNGKNPDDGIPDAARRLTPLECERLQGFPDDWTRYRHDGRQVGDTRRYEMLGNSIAVPCAAYIMQGMRQVLDGTF